MNEFETLSYAQQCAIIDRIARDARRAQARMLANSVRALFGFVANSVRPHRARSVNTVRPAAS